MIFLRKHQKKLLIVITVMIIASFSFFGAVSNLGVRDIPDKDIGKAIDGSHIRERELHAMIRFLSLGSHEVLQNDFFSTGLMAILAEKHFSQIQGDLQERLEKARRFTPFAHPQVPFLSASSVWSRFVPQLASHLDEIKLSDPSPQTFALYSDLYLDQLMFPPEMLSRVLQYQHQQLSGGSVDRALYDPRHLALFGYQTFEEWYGPRFTEILGKFFWNAAAIAEEKGYRVSLSEARADLLKTCLQAVPSRGEATFADASAFLRVQVQMAGIDETEAAKIWRKVMLVHRLFNEVGQGVLVDPLSYQEFSKFAEETATVETYRLPAALRFADFRSLLKFQYYLEAVAPKAKSKLVTLPSSFVSIEEAEKKAPELVVSRYMLEVAKISKDEVGSRLSLTETWEFEASDFGWNQLKAEFPTLARSEAPTREDRLQRLDTLEAALRLKIDQFARSILVKQHPEWIEEALSKVEVKKQAVAIRSQGSSAPFDDIEETASLRAFLHEIPVGEPKLFSHDQRTYYRITVLEKPVAKEIMTFQEALEGDWLGELLDRKLSDAYVNVRTKEPEQFKTKTGEWTSFQEVKDQVGALVYGDFLKQISDKPLSLDQYPCRRFVSLMETARKAIAAQEISLLQSTGNPLQDQWKLIQQTEEIQRSSPSTLAKLEMFTLAEGEWSSVSTPPNGDTAFFCLVKRQQPLKAIDDKIIAGQQKLGIDARRLLMHQILTRMDEYGSR